MKVLKFGSASIATADKVRHVTGIVSKEKGNIVVLSSMRGTAEALAEISNYLHNKNHEGAIEGINKLRKIYIRLIADLFEKEEIKKSAKELIEGRFEYIGSFTKGLFTLFEERAIMAQGELISSDIFHLYMKEQGLNAVLLPALDFIRIDRNSLPDTRFIKEELDKLLSASSNADVYITQGYICRNAYGEIDDLRKGGSDFTASLIGASVEAEEIQIWADVEMMQNSDPNYVEGTLVVKKMNFDEAAELAYFGAKILHPTRIAPAKLANIPVRLMSTQKIGEEGTIISNNTERGTIKAVAARDAITAINIKSGEMLLAHGFLRKVFDIFERYHTSVDMITSSEIGVSLTIDDAKNLEYIIDDLRKYGTVAIDTNMVIISVVGDLGTHKSRFAATILDAVKDIPIRMISYGGSKYNFSFLIEDRDKTQTLQILNDKLFK